MARNIYIYIYWKTLRETFFTSCFHESRGNASERSNRKDRHSGTTENSQNKCDQSLTANNYFSLSSILDASHSARSTFSSTVPSLPVSISIWTASLLAFLVLIHSEAELNNFPRMKRSMDNETGKRPTPMQIINEKPQQERELRWRSCRAEVCCRY